MNYFFLTFKDPKVEESYQITNQHQKRLSTFIALSFGFIFAFLVKVVQAILQKNMDSFYLNLIMLAYLIIQLLVIWRKNKYLRIGIVIFNHIVTIFFISLEDRADVDNQMAMLQGVNQMAVFYLLLLTGEYSEGMITIIILQIYRIIWGIMTSQAIQYSALITSTLLIVYINYFNYQYNKAKRAQYLLSLADSRWEEILQKLSLQQSYLILQFREENLHFSIKQFRNCEKLFNTVEEAGQFLKAATFQNVALENIIYRLINSYKEKCAQNFNNAYLINYQKRTIRTEISLYQGDSPTIMIQFKDFFYENKINPQIMYKQYQQVIKLMLKVLNRVNQYHYCQNKYQIMQRRIMLIHLIVTAKKEIKVKTINLNNFILHATYLYSNLKIQLIQKAHPQIETSINILQILLLQIFENTVHHSMQITVYETIEHKICCLFVGQFNIKNLTKFRDRLDLPCQLLFEQIQIQETMLQFTFRESVNVPFSRQLFHST